ncbi:MAG: hypothetical protein UY05_C0012G0012 [Candidatus Peregrinibacteria bacterium GW2011_GWA2_47_7]|nr:MAG: hypothetical protein UY05_C0012G0012 [Candidatus Peregrinibacteria bacterium GW2011_GWA2_47_7]
MIEAIILFGVPLFLLLLTITVLLHIVFQIPYVPSRNRVVNRMIRIADLKKDDVVFDLGCGDGRLLIAAEKQKGVKAAEGFEIAPLVYLLAQFRKWLAHSRMKIHFKNLFDVRLRRANVIFCYLLPGAMKRLSKKFRKECEKGTRIVSHTFRIPDMEPIKIFKKNKRRNLPTVYLYQI